MGYKSELQSNNTDLQSILDMILGLGLVDAPTVTLINFTVGNASYQAEEGMTWAEWCNSKYSTGDIACENNNVKWVADGSGRPIGYNGIYESPSSIIVNGRVYYLASGGGAD